MWNNSQWKQTVDQQKDSYITKTIRKSHQVGPCTSERRQRKGGKLHRHRSSSWNQILLATFLRSDTRKSRSLAGLKSSGTDSRAVEPRSYSSTCTCLLTHQARWKKQIETAQNCGQLSTTIPVLTLAPFWSLFLCDTAPHSGEGAAAGESPQFQGTESAQISPTLQQSAGSHYWHPGSRGSEVVQNSDWGLDSISPCPYLCQINWIL